MAKQHRDTGFLEIVHRLRPNQQRKLHLMTNRCEAARLLLSEATKALPEHLVTTLLLWQSFMNSGLLPVP